MLNDLYETRISDARWWLYDIPGNAGWIIYFVCMIRLLLRGVSLFAVAALIPAVLMLIGIVELIRERIAKLDRVIPRRRLLLGFGALTLGGILGTVISLIGLIMTKSSLWMLIGAVLCGVFAELLYQGYRKVER